MSQATELFTAEQVRRMLYRACVEAGKQEALAERLGVSSQYIGMVLKGRSHPGPSIVTGLGLTRIIAWRRTESAERW